MKKTMKFRPCDQSANGYSRNSYTMGKDYKQAKQSK